jgi:hypothetical protein
MTSAKVSTAPDTDKRSEDDTDASKEQVYGMLNEAERRIVGLAAVEEAVSRPKFIAQVTVEGAIQVLKRKNPSALDGTRWALEKSA